MVLKLIKKKKLIQNWKMYFACVPMTRGSLIFDELSLKETHEASLDLKQRGLYVKKMQTTPQS